MNAKKACGCALRFIAIGGLFLTPGWCQKITSLERERAQSMLQEIASDVRKHYYDSKFHGIDWESKTREMKLKIEQADTSNRALSEVAALLDSQRLSHFFPTAATRLSPRLWLGSTVDRRPLLCSSRAARQ